MDFRGKKVAVTGAGGFIGSHLVESLAEEGARVTAFVHYNSRGSWGLLESLRPELLETIDVVAGDVQDSVSVRHLAAGKDVVFHLAALIGIPYSYVAPQAYVATNVGGTLNVLEACRSERVPKLVHTSTSEAYGTAQFTPITEAHPLEAQSPYSASKIAADKLVDSYHRSFGLPTTTLRPFNNYGPRQSARAVIPTIISQALTQPVIELGSLDPVRDYLYVTDTVRAFKLAAVSEDAVGLTMNVGTGKCASIGDIAALILQLMGEDKPVVCAEERRRPEDSEVMQLVCDSSLAQDTLGWQPTVEFRVGLQEAIRWVRGNPDRFKPSRYNV